jgi:hypothetical protein
MAKLMFPNRGTRAAALLSFICIPFLFPAAVFPAETSADSSKAPGIKDSLQVTPPLPEEIFSRSRLGLQASEIDSLERIDIQSEEIERSAPFYLDDFFRRQPFFLSGDSLGNGFSRKFNSLGAGFDQLRVYLNGMPLDDPLTGETDWRMLSPEIVSSALILDGGALSGPRGGAGEIYLLTPGTDDPVSVSRIGIAGGAYEINVIGGGLKRTLFRTGGIDVYIKKIQQSTEDFKKRVEEFQYFTHLEKSLFGSALLSADGIFFADERRGPSGYSTKLEQKNTHIQLALTGTLKQKTSYKLAYWYASSHHSLETPVPLINLGARSDSYAGNLLYRPGEKLSLGLDIQGTKLRPVDFPRDSLSYLSGTSYKVLGTSRFKFPCGFSFNGAAGIRSVLKNDRLIIAELGLSGQLSPTCGLSLDWKREALESGLATRISLSRQGGEYPVYSPGRMSNLEAASELSLSGRRKIRLGLFTRRLENLTIAAYEPNPLVAFAPSAVDCRVNGFFYRYDGGLWGPFHLLAEGIELFNPPDRLPYLPVRRHTAALNLQGNLFQKDLAYSFQAEMTYEGDFRFPYTANPVTPLRLQPSRINFGGAGSIRIVDFTIYLRLDFLMSNYYNGIDPLRLPGPRAVLGVDWKFSG